MICVCPGLHTVGVLVGMPLWGALVQYRIEFSLSEGFIESYRDRDCQIKAADVIFSDGQCDALRFELSTN